MSEIFVPSSEWQEIPDFVAVLPNGGEYRMNLNGKNEARWDDPVPGPETVAYKPEYQANNVQPVNGQSPPQPAKQPAPGPTAIPVAAQATCASSPSRMTNAAPQANSPFSAPPGSRQDVLDKYKMSICTSEDLEKLIIKRREPLIGNWLLEGDLGFVYGERGGGKTWFVDALATHLSSGKELGEWEIPNAYDVLLLDGEMPIDAARDRLRGLAANNKKLHVLSHEVLFDRTGLVMNLTDKLVQQVITEICLQKNIKLLVLDNLSCLFSGLPENDSDAWELVLPWLFELRRNRIAILIVHHTSKAGTMRGTYRREDAAFWVIRVDPLPNHALDDKGARFETNFEKQRNSSLTEWTRKWNFQTETNGDVSIYCHKVPFDTKVLDLIEAGLHSATDIAKELKVNKSTVCRAAKRLIQAKVLHIRNRQYHSIRYARKVP